jgi:adenylate cyclase
MILFCEECGAKNSVDPLESQSGLQCSFCNAYLRLDRTVEKFKRQRLAENAQLKLAFQQAAMELSAARPLVTMGRKSANDLVVSDTKASRFHARIELRDNEFLLIDHSKNGTFVFVEGEQPMSLRQNSMPLSASGIIGLGRKIDPASDQIIRYEVI